MESIHDYLPAARNTGRFEIERFCENSNECVAGQAAYDCETNGLCAKVKGNEKENNARVYARRQNSKQLEIRHDEEITMEEE